MRVLLLNPPSDETVIRDYYCSKTSKSNYLFQPIDLVMQSGILANDHEVDLLDAVVEKLDTQKTAERVQAYKPDIILGLIGAVRRKRDLAFYEYLMNAFDARLFLSGDVVLEDGEKLLARHDYIEGLLLRFISPGLAHYLNGQAFEDLIYRDGQDVKVTPAAIAGKEYRVPTPKHELFEHPGYRFSFARGRRFATVLTDFGCPYKCSFCVMGTLGFKMRPVEDVVEEIETLFEHGIREYFFADQCFAAVRERGLRLCKALAEKVPGIGFTTFTRPDLLDTELVQAIKAAGGHTLIMGVESADQETLERCSKRTDMDKIRSGFQLCRSHRIRSVATFIIGLPGDTKQSIESTMHLARELAPDFVSYNVAVPREGTELRREAMQEGMFDADAEMDQAGAEASMATKELTREQVAALKRKAVRDFYLRPGYLIGHLRGIGSWKDFTSQVREGLALIVRNI